MEKETTLLRIKKEDLKKLKVIAAKEGKTMQEIITKVVDELELQQNFNKKIF